MMSRSMSEHFLTFGDMSKIVFKSRVPKLHPPIVFAFDIFVHLSISYLVTLVYKIA